jgi:diguanylate cyclase (GGDEF)-like protein
MITGILAFTLTDFYYLWAQIQGVYQFGQFSDEGWLIGLALISLSFWYQPNESKSQGKIHPALIAISIFISPALLSAIALRPDYFPTYVVIPTITTLLLAFIRMTLVIRQANNLGEEKVLARTDELTGLPNRRRLIAEIDSFNDVEGALLLLDLDGFKPVNDLYGHEMGDRILRQVSQRFSRSLPSGAILARLGGDEFGVIAAGSDDLTLELASALKATLSYPFFIDGKSISISVSIGHVRNDGNGDLLHRADLAMYEAKRINAEARAYQP